MDFLEKPVDGDKLQLLLEKAKLLTLENDHNQCLLDSIEDKMNVSNVAELAYLIAKSKE